MQRLLDLHNCFAAKKMILHADISYVLPRAGELKQIPLRSLAVQFE